MKYALGFLLAVVLVTSTSATAADTRPNLRQVVADKFRDPSSVQFRGTRNVRTVDGQPGLYGEVNAKNAFGAYVGFTSFCASGRSVLFAKDFGADFVAKECGQR